jgi:hypothetical protein
MIEMYSLVTASQFHIIIENLENFISSLGTDSTVLTLTGDTNLCALKDEFKPLKHICEKFSLSQVITDTTHNLRLIDQIFVGKNLKVHSCGIGHPVEKAHCQTWAKLFQTFQSTQESDLLVWQYRKADWLAINISLMKSNLLSEICKAASVEQAAEILQQQIINSIQTHIPKGKRKTPHKEKDWTNPHLIKLHKAKCKSFRLWKQRNSDTLRKEYKKLEKLLRKEIFLSKKTFFYDSFQKCTEPSSFWKALKIFTCRNKTKTIPPLISQCGAEASDNRGKAELLREQFQSVFSTGKDTSMFRNAVTNDTINYQKTCIKYLLRKITTTPNKKAPGGDGISMVVLKKCAIVLAPCVVSIADRCLVEGKFPHIWKEAIVCPIPKKNDSSSPSDYRPISLLSTISKLVESLINQILLNEIEPHLSKSQFGFRQNRSTSDAILLFQHYVLRGFEKCELNNSPTRVAAVFFDISKAFDCVPHDQILQSLTDDFHLPASYHSLHPVVSIKQNIQGQSQGQPQLRRKRNLRSPTRQCDRTNIVYKLYQCNCSIKPPPRLQDHSVCG